MAYGVVLIQTKPSYEREVIEDLNKKVESDRNPSYRGAHTLFGEWDFLLELDVDSHDEISKLVMDEIRNIPGVVDTITYSPNFEFEYKPKKPAAVA